MIITKKKMLEMFGKFQDKEIANVLDISLSHVRNFRQSQGIKPLKKNKMTSLERNRLYLYKMSPLEYTNMLKKQNGACAICGEVKGKYVIDHDHLTGKVRGILCHACNVGIGNLKDSASIVQKALKYLKRNY